MKLVDAVLCLVIFAMANGFLTGGLYDFHRKNQKCLEMEKQFACEKFLCESFRKTCAGRGFENLNEWQKTCGALWRCEYIGWTEAEDFLIDRENADEKGKLFYGCWKGENGSGEVYCRMRVDDK